jgi:putative pyruvate formate lyase activating enzyme
MAVIDLASFSSNVRALWDRMNPCILCPQNCRVDRSRGQIGFCGIGDQPVVSSVTPHFGEESVLVGRGGSGTIFFAGCNLRCVFCQNYDISHGRAGRRTTVGQLADAMLGLQHSGCSNINFVTPSHLAAPIAAAIESARTQGLAIPTVYNSGGYDSVETLRLLEGLIDIYMPDMKYADATVAAALSAAKDYPVINFAAVKEMHRQVGDLQVEGGLATRGLLIRHLVLPHDLAGSIKIIDFLATEVSPHTTINIMDQYRPCYQAHLYSEIDRRLTRDEISAPRRYAIDKGLTVLE